MINQYPDIDWKMIWKYKQDLINKGNECKNCNQIKYIYKQGDKVLLKNAWKTKLKHDVYLGPFVIAAVRNNGTVRDHKGKVTDAFIIQNLISYV